MHRQLGTPNLERGGKMTVTITIDGKYVEVKEGSTILQAARDNDLYIPTLCEDPRLEPYGGCRLCLVQITGMP